jgi:ATP-binding cassette subfamily B protein
MKFIKEYFRVFEMIWKADSVGFSFQLVLQSMLAGIPVAMLYLTKQLLDQILLAQTFDIATMRYLLFMAGIYVANILLTQVQSHVSFTNQHRVSTLFSEKILLKSTKVPFEYNENSTYQNSLHLAQQQSLYKIPQVYQVIQMVLVNSFTLIALLSYFFNVLSDFAGWILLLAIPLSVVKWISGNALVQLDKKLVGQERESSYLHHILIGVSFAKEVKTLHVGDSLIKRFSHLKAFIFQRKRSLQLKMSLFSSLAELLEVAVVLYVMYQIIDLAIAKLIAFSVLVIYLQGLQRIQSTLKTCLQNWVQLLQQRVFLKDLFEYLDLPEESRGSVQINPDLSEELFIKDLHFKYPGSERWALKGIDLQVKRGEIIAIVGANGSGKSTMVKLMAGLYASSSGEIRWKNASLHEIDSGEFAKETTFVFQDFEKYYLSIAEFVGFGMEEEIDDLRMNLALKQADALDFVQVFKQKFHVKLGRFLGAGEELSGGQWQKLVIARAFLRDSPLWVFDEPTSSIDAISEAIIFENIKARAKERVCILITHRLYNLKFVDRIYVIDKGEIVEQGSFEELKEHSTIFNALYEQQKV